MAVLYSVLSNNVFSLATDEVALMSLAYPACIQGTRIHLFITSHATCPAVHISSLFLIIFVFLSLVEWWTHFAIHSSIRYAMSCCSALQSSSSGCGEWLACAEPVCCPKVVVIDTLPLALILRVPSCSASIFAYMRCVGNLCFSPVGSALWTHGDRARWRTDASHRRIRSNEVYTQSTLCIIGVLVVVGLCVVLPFTPARLYGMI